MSVRSKIIWEGNNERIFARIFPSRKKFHLLFSLCRHFQGRCHKVVKIDNFKNNLNLLQFCMILFSSLKIQNLILKSYFMKSVHFSFGLNELEWVWGRIKHANCTGSQDTGSVWKVEKQTSLVWSTYGWFVHWLFKNCRWLYFFETFNAYFAKVFNVVTSVKISFWNILYSLICKHFHSSLKSTTSCESFQSTLSWRVA